MTYGHIFLTSLAGTPTNVLVLILSFKVMRKRMPKKDMNDQQKSTTLISHLDDSTISTIPNLSLGIEA